MSVESWIGLYRVCRHAVEVVVDAVLAGGRAPVAVFGDAVELSAEACPCWRLRLCLQSSRQRVESRPRTPAGELLLSSIPFAELAPSCRCRNPFPLRTAFSRTSVRTVQTLFTSEHPPTYGGRIAPGRTLTDAPTEALYCPGLETRFALLVIVDTLCACVCGRQRRARVGVMRD